MFFFYSFRTLGELNRKQDTGVRTDIFRIRVLVFGDGSEAQLIAY